MQDEFEQAEGILDMEQLSKLKPVDKDTKIGEEKVSLNYASGPYLYEGSNEFAVMYQENDKHIYKKIIYSLPNSTTNVLINDIDDKVNMSTFRSDGKILLKVA